MTPVFSIIIPHKNTPELLERCIESVPERDDLQIIVIDDNSDSEHVDFSVFPGLCKENVTVIFDKSSKGAGHARNIGLSVATGKWLLFADADDYYTPELARMLDKYAGIDNVDTVYFNCKGEYGKTNRCLRYNRMIEDYLSGNQTAMEEIKYKMWVPWNKMFRKEMITRHNLLFEEIMSGNDAKFCLLASYFSRFSVVEADCCYICTEQINSITTKNKTLEQRLEALPGMLRIVNFINYVGLSDKTYSRNIMSPKLLLSLYRSYGMIGILKYLKVYFREKSHNNLYPELT